MSYGLLGENNMFKIRFVFKIKLFNTNLICKKSFDKASQSNKIILL